MAASITGGLADQVDGWVEDDLAFVRGWGFDPAAVGAPALLLQGSEDLMVPAAHVAWLGARIGDPAQVPVLTGQGHLSLMAGIDDVHGWLADHL